MTSPILPGALHHLALTDTDVECARIFYSEVVGLQVVAMIAPKVFLTKGRLFLVLGRRPIGLLRVTSLPRIASVLIASALDWSAVSTWKVLQAF